MLLGPWDYAGSKIPWHLGGNTQSHSGFVPLLDSLNSLTLSVFSDACRQLLSLSTCLRPITRFIRRKVAGAAHLGSAHYPPSSSHWVSVNTRLANEMRMGREKVKPSAGDSRWLHRRGVDLCDSLKNVECEPTSASIFPWNWLACKKLLILRARSPGDRPSEAWPSPPSSGKAFQKPKGLNGTLMKGLSLMDTEAVSLAHWMRLNLDMNAGQPRLSSLVKQTCQWWQMPVVSDMALALSSVTGQQFISLWPIFISRYPASEWFPGREKESMLCSFTWGLWNPLKTSSWLQKR